ncbi:MAG TPA: FimV/HubP family polar landmark protein [Quisquiliibacterium sp.]|nr:FimV/HubP family polar landmark protein [Quisquiliibacterium sp.]
MLPNPTPKRIAAAVALALAAGVAGTSWAAGLGRLTVQSALGQPLRAEVEVSSLTPAEAASISARLAPAEAFRQAGLQFNPALSNLRFAIDKRADGRTFVRITSAQPINEPFVDLLVELNWASGRFVREYTFLLDPPELRTAGRETVEGGNVVQSSVVPPVAAPARAPAPPPSGAAPAAAAPAAAAPAAAPAVAARTAQPAPAGQDAAGGPVQVRSGDSLAAIASRVKPGSVSLDQALVAIYQANRGAFYGGVHQLRAGSTLAIPDEQAMASVGAAQAREQIRAHTRDFNAYRARLADSARTVAAAPSGQSAEGRIGASVEERGAPAGAGDQLKVSRGAPAVGADAGASAAGTSATRAAEQGVAREAATREAQSRVADLEKNVSDLQQLVELKNRQLAELQKQVEEAKLAGQSAAGAIAPKAEGSAAPAPAPAVSAPAPATPPAAAESSPSSASGTTAGPGPAASDSATPASQEADKPVAEKPAAAARPATAPAAPVATPGLVDDLMSNPLMLPGLAAILALGAGYGWYSMRRRRKVEKFEDSLIAADGFATNSLFGSTGGQSVDTTSSSVFSASTRDSGVDVHATEVDPIAEAEVYIAYGREAQAEEILREALRKQPERQAIRAKLLEIMAGRKDAQAFSALAAEMYEQTGGQNEEWPKIATMGLALDPANPMFTGGAPVGASAPGQSFGGAASAPQGGAGLQGAGTIAAAAAALGAAGSALAASRATAEAPAPAAEPGPEIDAVDFSVLEDAPRGFVETQPLADEAPSAGAALEPEVPALDFDLDLDTTIGKAGGSLSSPRREEDSADRTELEKAVDGRFDLPSLDLELPGKGKPAAAPSEEDAVLGFDDLDIDLPALESVSRSASPKAAPHAAAELPEIDLSSIGLDLEPAPVAPVAGEEGERWQEMATKLDLASAYEEIGDKEGARELLDEVVKGGDAEQQKKARAMLARIV